MAPRHCKGPLKIPVYEQSASGQIILGAHSHTASVLYFESILGADNALNSEQ